MSKENMHADIEEIILKPEEIEERIQELAKQIRSDYQGKDMFMVCILNGASVFYIELLMSLDIQMEMNFMRVSSYGSGTQSSGKLRIIYDLEKDITGKDVLIVEDIIDSGHTLKRLTEMLKERGARDVKSVVLLDKPERREVEMEADYVGFKVPDKFLVGFGLDYDGKYRNLRYIGTLKPEIYN